MALAAPLTMVKLDYVLARVDPDKDAMVFLSDFPGQERRMFRSIEKTYSTLLPTIFDALIDFYYSYNKGKQDEIPDVLEAWKGNEDQMLEALGQKYKTNFFAERWPELLSKLSRHKEPEPKASRERVHASKPTALTYERHTVVPGSTVTRRQVSPKRKSFQKRNNLTSPPHQTRTHDYERNNGGRYFSPQLPDDDIIEEEDHIPGDLRNGLHSHRTQQPSTSNAMPPYVKQRILKMFSERAPEKVGEVLELLDTYESRGADTLLMVLKDCWDRHRSTSNQNNNNNNTIQSIDNDISDKLAQYFMEDAQPDPQTTTVEDWDREQNQLLERLTTHMTPIRKQEEAENTRLRGEVVALHQENDILRATLKGVKQQYTSSMPVSPRGGHNHDHQLQSRRPMDDNMAAHDMTHQHLEYINDILTGREQAREQSRSHSGHRRVASPTRRISPSRSPDRTREYIDDALDKIIGNIDIKVHNLRASDFKKRRPSPFAPSSSSATEVTSRRVRDKGRKIDKKESYYCESLSEIPRHESVLRNTPPRKERYHQTEIVQQQPQYIVQQPPVQPQQPTQQIVVQPAVVQPAQPPQQPPLYASHQLQQSEPTPQSVILTSNPQVLSQPLPVQSQQLQPQYVQQHLQPQPQPQPQQVLLSQPEQRVTSQPQIVQQPTLTSQPQPQAQSYQFSQPQLQTVESRQPLPQSHQQEQVLSQPVLTSVPYALQPALTSQPQVAGQVQQQPVLTSQQQVVEQVQQQPVVTSQPQVVGQVQQPVLTSQPQMQATMSSQPQVVGQVQQQPVMTSQLQQVQQQPVLTSQPQVVEQPVMTSQPRVMEQLQQQPTLTSNPKQVVSQPILTAASAQQQPVSQPQVVHHQPQQQHLSASLMESQKEALVSQPVLMSTSSHLQQQQPPPQQQLHHQSNSQPFVVQHPVSAAASQQLPSQQVVSVSQPMQSSQIGSHQQQQPAEMTLRSQSYRSQPAVVEKGSFHSVPQQVLSNQSDFQKPVVGSSHKDLSDVLAETEKLFSNNSKSSYSAHKQPQSLPSNSSFATSSAGPAPPSQHSVQQVIKTLPQGVTPQDVVSQPSVLHSNRESRHSASVPPSHKGSVGQSYPRSDVHISKSDQGVGVVPSGQSVSQQLTNNTAGSIHQQQVSVGSRPTRHSVETPAQRLSSVVPNPPPDFDRDNGGAISRQPSIHSLQPAVVNGQVVEVKKSHSSRPSGGSSSSSKHSLPQRSSLHKSLSHMGDQSNHSTGLRHTNSSQYQQQQQQLPPLPAPVSPGGMAPSSSPTTVLEIPRKSSVSSATSMVGPPVNTPMVTTTNDGDYSNQLSSSAGQISLASDLNLTHADSILRQADAMNATLRSAGSHLSRKGSRHSTVV
eukprot:TRINITY_DN4568_c0_g1_i1.p1 TRINITY_DN4568_c0_g1~~TRINITY_DN4568_c0_g1_i1.p1  ORF type:complete len:1361 (+),score=289.51 TRINITY_DN4568_c0_g1_i1:51-4133(+)